MTERVSQDEIEAIVGATRHGIYHLARAVSAESAVYVLHSNGCLVEHHDPRECPLSLAMDDPDTITSWDEVEDRVSLVALTVHEDGTRAIMAVPLHLGERVV